MRFEDGIGRKQCPFQPDGAGRGAVARRNQPAAFEEALPFRHLHRNGPWRVKTLHRLKKPPYTFKYVRWCERTGPRDPSYPISFRTSKRCNSVPSRFVITTSGVHGFCTEHEVYCTKNAPDGEAPGLRRHMRPPTAALSSPLESFAFSVAPCRGGCCRPSL